MILNPNNQIASYIPDKIQHYPIINSKLNILAGEEGSRRFDYKLVVTNPDQISEIEKNKKQAWMQDLSMWATQESESEEDATRDLEKIEKYNKYEWQDIREIKGNALLEHYKKELSIPSIFNKGFFNALWSGEEVYQCDIVGGEPTFEMVNPNKLIVLRSGSSSKIEDADMLVLWDFKSPGQIIDTYYDVLTNKDIEYIDRLPWTSSTDGMDNEDPSAGYSFRDIAGASYGEGVMIEGDPLGVETLFSNSISDGFGNIRVIKVLWKSFKKILKVKSYNFETGEEEYNFYPETYIPNKELGEEATPLW